MNAVTPMLLTLALVGAHSSSDVREISRVFDRSGGTIGRLPDNDWVLSDPRVSGHHASVCFAGGTFYLEDTSRNGVFLNASDRPLARGCRHALKSGDRLRIDPFEIEATIAAAPTPAAPPSFDPFGRESSPDAPNGARQFDPLALLGLQEDAPPSRRVPAAADAGGHSVLHEHYRPPVAIEPPSPPPVPKRMAHTPIPHDYNPLVDEVGGGEAVLPELDVPPARIDPAAPGAAATPAAGAADAPVTLAAMLAAAGLPDVAVTPELAARFGSLLRVVVAGMMSVLEARQQAKEDFKIGRTRFRPSDNNPLKLSANVDDALHNLLVKRNAAYLGLVEAFEDAFEDLRQHQAATQAAMRAAFDAALEAFDPDRLQQRFDRDARESALIPLPPRLRYWNRYRDTVLELRRDRDQTFQLLFAGEFKKVYDDERLRLKTACRSNGAGRRV